MLISEIITKLEELKEKHGDCQVYYNADIIDDGLGYLVEDITYKPHFFAPDYDDQNENNEDVCVNGIFIKT